MRAAAVRVCEYDSHQWQIFSWEGTCGICLQPAPCPDPTETFLYPQTAQPGSEQDLGAPPSTASWHTVCLSLTHRHTQLYVLIFDHYSNSTELPAYECVNHTESLTLNQTESCKLNYLKLNRIESHKPKACKLNHINRVFINPELSGTEYEVNHESIRLNHIQSNWIIRNVKSESMWAEPYWIEMVVTHLNGITQNQIKEGESEN